MFNVTRTYPAPDCSDYHSKEVVVALRQTFYGKCYLCENETSNPVVEHFKAHKGNKKLMHDWNNLYYACERCNSIKEAEIDNKNIEILDCCDSATDVFNTIKCLCASVPNGVFSVEAQNNDVKTLNTAQLLHRCYNENNTAIRCISRKQLHEKIFQKYSEFLFQSNKLYDLSSSEKEKNRAKEELKNMTDVSYPFSVFWKWHIKSDKFLSAQIPEHN